MIVSLEAHYLEPLAPIEADVVVDVQHIRAAQVQQDVS
jgi:hypothetical protein